MFAARRRDGQHHHITLYTVRTQPLCVRQESARREEILSTRRGKKEKVEGRGAFFINTGVHLYTLHTQSFYSFSLYCSLVVSKNRKKKKSYTHRYTYGRRYHCVYVLASERVNNNKITRTRHGCVSRLPLRLRVRRARTAMTRNG